MKPSPHTAMASPRCWNGKISQRIAWESGMIGPPPSPWKTRATMSVVRSGAAPETNELTTNSEAHTRNTRLRPKRPTSQPVAGMTTALAARYEVMTHEASSSPADSEPCRCGRMTLATLVSRICMKATTITVKVMAHFCVAETGASGGGVIACTVRRSYSLLRLQPHLLEGRRPRVRVDEHQRGLGHARPDGAGPD